MDNNYEQFCEKVHNNLIKNIEEFKQSLKESNTQYTLDIIRHKNSNTINAAFFNIYPNNTNDKSKIYCIW
jgi:hypothetical protein